METSISNHFRIACTLIHECAVSSSKHLSFPIGAFIVLYTFEANGKQIAD